MTARPLGSGVSRHRDDQAVTVTTIYRLAARKRRSLVLIERDAVILIQRGGLQSEFCWLPADDPWVVRGAATALRFSLGAGVGKSEALCLIAEHRGE
jgi:hypothetical protein